MTRQDRSSVCLLVLALGGAAASALFLAGQQQEALVTISGACWFVIVALVLERAQRDPPAKVAPTVEPGPPSSGQRALNRGGRCGPHRLEWCIVCARRATGGRVAPAEDAEPTVMVRMEDRR